MNSIETDRIACYIFPRGKIDRSSDWVSVVGSQTVYPGEEYPQKGFPTVALFDDVGGRCIDQFQLVFISQGSGVFIDRGVEYTVSEGSVFLLRPGFWHSYNPNPATGWTEYFIGFNGDTFSKIIKDSISDEGNVYILTEEQKCFFSKMLKFAQIDDDDVPILLNSMLFMILALIVFGQAASPNGGKKSSKLIVKVRDYMEKNIEKQFGLQELAAQMGISYTAFNTVFKEQTGMSPIRYLGKMRLQKAKYNLLKTNLSVKHIASECGFASTEYFCNYFRKETNMTPSQFRDQFKTMDL